MESSRTEYPALLASLQPEQAVNALNDRIALVNRVNGDIADWLQERRKVEEAYVAGLRKLARRQQPDGAAALGVFQTPWQRIVSSIENMAAAHETLAAKIDTDVESPLRAFQTKNREMQAVTSSQGNIAAIAKDLTRAQSKAAKGGRKADSASSNAEDASRMWESQAPYVFEQLQALDEMRLNHLRDVLTQFQTHEVDSIEKMRASAESCLNALLNVETADEINTFAAKLREARPTDTLTQRRSSVAGSQRPTSSSLRVPPTPPPPRHGNAVDDRQIQQTGSYTNAGRLAPVPEPTPTKEKSRLGGLKRLGTVMSRRKSTAPPAPPPPLPHSGEEKRKTRSFAPFRRGDSSRSFQDLEATGGNLPPSSGNGRRPISSRQESYVSSVRDEPHPQEPPLLMTNGTTSQPQPTIDGRPEAITEATVAPPSSPPHPGSSHSQAAASPAPPPAVQAPVVQEPPTVDPIAQAQQEATLATLTGDDSGRGFQIRAQPIKEDESEAQLALSNLSNQLRTQAQSSGINRVQGSVRGRRDVRNTMFVPTTVEPPSSSISHPTAPPLSIPPPSGENILASPIVRPPTATAMLHDDHTISDTTSIHSSRSLAGPTHHVDLHGPGLNASLVETVNTFFSDSGVAMSVVQGEVALAYNPPTIPTTGDTAVIRVSQFQLLDKVAVNPIFVKESQGVATEETAGTYTVALAPIRKPTPTVAFKYQLHMDGQSLAAHSPILLTPAWQVVENQVSVIVLYALNPTFGTEPITFKNVTVVVSLDQTGDAAKAQSAMMMPNTGSFKRKHGAVVWRLPELAVKTEQERMLVRFTTAGLGKRGSVELKFELPGRIASTVGIETQKEDAKENDPFADQGEGNRESADVGRWEEVPGRKLLVAGRYSATEKGES